jgi:soluble lytic murein transglycosylase
VRRVVLTTLAALVIGALGTPAAAGDTLYRYVDADGVVHFSNRPSDPRYKPVPSLTRPRGLTVSRLGNAPRGSGHFTRLRSSGSPPRNSTYDGLILRHAQAHGLQPALVKAVIAAESAFDPSARSSKGAMGLMQLMPDTASDLGVRNPYRVEDNIRGGSRYLREMLDRYSNNLSHALAAYNAGPGTVDEYRGLPPFPETRDYVSRVLSYYRRYNGDFAR